MHHTPPNEEQSVEGVLMYSERLQSETQSTENKSGHIRIDCEEFLQKSNLANTEFASKVYLKAVQFTMDGTIEQ